MVNPRPISLLLCWVLAAAAYPAVLTQQDGRTVSPAVFESLEELARIVDISYCVGSSGIHKPFHCLSRCSEFEGFELVTTWNTGPLLSDSCGYIAISHAPFEKRVIVAFRGTYSIANTIADLSTNPAEYAPFPSDQEDETVCAQETEPRDDKEALLPQLLHQSRKRSPTEPECKNCTVHAGFMKSWRHTRCTIIPHVEEALAKYPDYQLVLVGHSLGGAVATLAALEFQARGWTPQVTTFGEPRLGNRGLNEFIDRRFNTNATGADDALLRRVTHADDPVPLLPLEEWGYRMHAGEIYISKPSLPVSRTDVQNCVGDEDPNCIQGGDRSTSSAVDEDGGDAADSHGVDMDSLTIPKRYRLWQIFFAHRDYFWRLGLCMPGGDPWDWNRGRYKFDSTNDEL